MEQDMAAASADGCLAFSVDQSPGSGCTRVRGARSLLDADSAWAIHSWRTVRSDAQVIMVDPGT
eukprot:8954216-Lingulodinium_polyedra.AAC.1